LPDTIFGPGFDSICVLTGTATVAEWQFSPNLIYIYVKSRNFTLVKLKSFG
jgi:hypothetical protein